MVRAWLSAHGSKLAVVLGLALLVPVVTGNVGGGKKIFAAVNAPQNDDSIKVFAGQSGGFFHECPETARAEIVRDGFTVYPGYLGEFELENCEGSVEIPYNQFARENGPYQVKIHMGSDTAVAPFSVEKVVDWVFVRSVANSSAERTSISVALADAKAQPLRTGIFTSGELVLDIYWEDCDNEGTLPGILPQQPQDCQADHDHVFHGTVPVDERSNTVVIVPWDNFESSDFENGEAEDGWYNVTATFHNEEALGNSNVPMDPTVFQRDPPGNWFEVDRE